MHYGAWENNSQIKQEIFQGKFLFPYYLMQKATIYTTPWLPNARKNKNQFKNEIELYKKRFVIIFCIGKQYIFS